jgi:hypothetical protein
MNSKRHCSRDNNLCENSLCKERDVDDEKTNHWGNISCGVGL